MTYSNLGPWEDDGLPTDEPDAPEPVTRLTTALQAALNAGLAGTGKRVIMGAELDALIAERRRQRAEEALSHDDRAEAVESGRPLSHQRADDGEHER